MEFILWIDENKFRSTNAIWNNLGLNKPSSVGYVANLIDSKIFNNKEEWEEFYYSSGAERLKTDKASASQYGRTKEELREKAKTLYNAVKDNGYNLTLEECEECVRFRVICETWNGIVIRERNTVNVLQKQYPTWIFKKTTGEIDYKYAIDYEIYKGKSLIAAIQIKPVSYLKDNHYIDKARRKNKEKNSLYIQKFGVPVYDIISESSGTIVKMIKRSTSSIC
jgi:hypothetical protein